MTPTVPTGSPWSRLWANLGPILWCFILGGFSILLSNRLLQLLPGSSWPRELLPLRNLLLAVISAFFAYILVTLDLRNRQRAQDALRESEERYALAALGANDGLWDWNLKSNCVYFSERWKNILGYQDDELGEDPEEWLRRIHSEDRPQFDAEFSAHLEGRSPYFESEHRILHKDRTYRFVLTRGSAVRDVNGKAYRVAGSQTDITERKVAEEQLLRTALYDPLTGLPNRALFMDRLGRALRRTRRRQDYCFAVLFLDLDRFKVINDSLGHIVGDQLLVGVARRLETCLRGVDTVGRMGGDEFTILLDDIKGVADATDVAERIHQALRIPFEIDRRDLVTSASIGIALSTRDYNEPEDLLRDADTAMYRSKALGKSQHVLFDETMHAGALARLRLETALWSAMEHHDFRLHYQPIVALDSGRITGFEALLRWQDPERGLVSPGEFIPLAEETSLIIPIGQWALLQACADLHEWHQLFPEACPLTVSVNLSSRHFLQPDLAEQVNHILVTNQLEPQHLKLEITESAIMNATSATPILSKLRELGVQLCIDDFGTGYSSLSYLHRFPVNTLKIDRSFVSPLGEGAGQAEIVRAIVTLAHNLGMDVTAEGVETKVQLEQLQLLHCESAQGYLFSRPVDADQIKAILAGHKGPTAGTWDGSIAAAPSG